MTLILNDKFTIIVGLGKTGVSCARYLAVKGERFGVVDTRDQPASLASFEVEFPDVPVECGALQLDTLLQAHRLIVSPGVARHTVEILAAEKQGVEILGDIDLFCLEVSNPIVAITGSNAKSTVTSLLGKMAETANFLVGVGGNIGTPVLDLLMDETTSKADLYVLELSSFQLETTSKLRAAAATILNVSADHMDRYPDLMSYQQAKQRIYRGCETAIFNADDLLTQPLIAKQVPCCRFGLGRPDLKDFGLLDEQGQQFLTKGLRPLMPVSELKMPGLHNVANALAALALGDAVKIPMAAMLKTLRTFAGLPHRCQWVREIDSVRYFNDSKGTNVGATVAAIEGLGCSGNDSLGHESAGNDNTGKIVLIAGGDGKGADFSELNGPLMKMARAVVLIGRDREAIAQALSAELAIQRADSLDDAVEQSRSLAQAGDLVLLSPACASFDMFKGFEDRGEQFCQLVEALR